MRSGLGKIFSIFLMLWSLSGTLYAAPALIVDTDVGVDDVIALLYLLNRPELDLKAITIVGNGNAHCEPALRNTLGLLKLTHYRPLPVACGSEQPLAGKHHFPTAVLEESDGLVGTAALLPKAKPTYQG